MKPCKIKAANRQSAKIADYIIMFNDPKQKRRSTLFVNRRIKYINYNSFKKPPNVLQIVMKVDKNGKSFLIGRTIMLNKEGFTDKQLFDIQKQHTVPF